MHIVLGKGEDFLVMKVINFHHCQQQMRMMKNSVWMTHRVDKKVPICQSPISSFCLSNQLFEGILEFGEYHTLWRTHSARGLPCNSWNGLVSWYEIWQFQKYLIIKMKLCYSILFRLYPWTASSYPFIMTDVIIFVNNNHIKILLKYWRSCEASS